MEVVTVTRDISAPGDQVRDRILDVEPFMEAAGFTDVVVEEDEIRISNTVGIFQIELVLVVVDRPDAVLAYEQREGIFKSMTTEYSVLNDGSRTTVEARTEFALDAPFAGPVFDATLVKRQRRKELEAQFDHLETVTGN